MYLFIYIFDFRGIGRNEPIDINKLAKESKFQFDPELLNKLVSKVHPNDQINTDEETSKDLPLFNKFDNDTRSQSNENKFVEDLISERVVQKPTKESAHDITKVDFDTSLEDYERENPTQSEFKDETDKGTVSPSGKGSSNKISPPPHPSPRA